MGVKTFLFPGVNVVLLILILTVFPVCDMAMGQSEPDPEFAASAGDVAGFINPETDVLVEGETLIGGPASWAVITSDWLNIACSGGEAIALRVPGECEAEVTVPRDGIYYLWVRSHGAPGRSFQVWVNDAQASTTFGYEKMSWRRGGTFKLTKGTVKLYIRETLNNPYLDCLLLTRDPELNPENLKPLRAFGGDERWERTGEPVRFSGEFSNGQIVNWNWDFGDGTAGNGKQISHLYKTPGNYAFTLTISDFAGRTNKRKEIVHIWPDVDYTAFRFPVKRIAGGRFGDINGDGLPDCILGDPFRWVDAYLHDGTLLWSYDSPPEFKLPDRREHPMVIWDFDGDGKGEVMMWRFVEGKEWLCLCDGVTGSVRNRVPWPVVPGYVNGRLAVGNLTGKPGGATILMLNGHYGGQNSQQADAYDANLNHLWSYSRDGGDALGHFIYSCDVDGDGREEVFISAAILHSDGSIGWERKDLFKNHADSIRLGDINGDGKVEVVYAYSELGVYVLDAATGTTLWHIQTNHAQQLEIGDVRPDVPGMEVIVGDRFYLPTLRAKLLLFDCKGNLLSSFPKMAITGNPNLGVFEWDGKKGLEIAWDNMVLDGRFNVLAVLPSHLHHAFDFMGEGGEEFVGGMRVKDQLFVAAFADPNRVRNLPRKNDYEARRKTANHSHY